jgi:integrase
MNPSNFFLSKRQNGYWYIWYRLGSRKCKISTKSRRKSEALLFLSEFKEKTKPKPRDISFSEFVKEHAEIEGPNLRQSTLLGIYEKSFRKFETICGNRSLETYTARDVDIFKAKRSKDCSPATVNIEFRSLKAAFNCAVRWDLIRENPFAKCHPMRVPERRPTYLTEEEFQRLYAATNEQSLKRLFLFAVLTGMRLGEILNLQWTSIDFERKLILISNSADFLTKTGKLREVPMNGRVLELLEEIRLEGKDCSYVFQLNMRRLNKSYVDHKFREYRKAAQLKDDISFHSLRHTFATWLVQKKVPIFEVQKLLGHSDIKVTQIYSHLAASDLHDAVQKITDVVAPREIILNNIGDPPLAREATVQLDK